MRFLFCSIGFCLIMFLLPASSSAELRVGAAVVDVTPPQFPVLVNGGMLSRNATEVKTSVNARSLVLDDGAERLAIVVVDSCMMPRPLLDEAKQLAASRTKIRPERMLISATHTHTAPSCMGALGTDADPSYVSYLREKLAQAIAEAEQNLEPAKVGWGVAPAGDFTALRRWVRRPDRVVNDPFGNPTVRATMHAARNWDDVTGETGPEDPDLAMISFVSTEGRPIALLANFSMHYFGDRPISADYFGLFAAGFKAEVAKPDKERPEFVGILSHGCSGDIWRRDYAVPPEQRTDPTIEEYTSQLLEVALETYRNIEYAADADLAMAEARMQLNYRVPNVQLLEWAQRIVDAMGDEGPQNQTEVYAREQLILHERQSTEIVVQALRIGDVAIASTPNETYALSGLKLKLQSPLPQTMVIELANGGDGYIPPPEQHELGGYNTWAARSAGLEVQAEPKIVEQALTLLEQVAGKPRRDYKQPQGPLSKRIQQHGPVAYWRLDEFSGPRAKDASGHARDGIFESGVAYFLPGPRSSDFTTANELNRSAHFAGGRVQARLEGLDDTYSASLWIWNGMPVEGRATAGWCFSRGHDYGLGPGGDHLGLGGTATKPGCLLYQSGSGPAHAGKTPVERWTWNHVALVRDGARVRVYLNGELEIESDVEPSTPHAFESVFVGGRSDRQDNWEGRLDEVAVFDRALSPEEVKQLAN